MELVTSRFRWLRIRLFLGLGTWCFQVETLRNVVVRRMELFDTTLRQQRLRVTHPADGRVFLVFRDTRATLDIRVLVAFLVPITRTTLIRYRPTETPVQGRFCGTIPHRFLPHKSTSIVLKTLVWISACFWRCCRLRKRLFFKISQTLLIVRLGRSMVLPLKLGPVTGNFPSNWYRHQVLVQPISRTIRS